jgi:hypothetical protein
MTKDEAQTVILDLSHCLVIMATILEKKPITIEENNRIKYVDKVMKNSFELLGVNFEEND